MTDFTHTCFNWVKGIQFHRPIQYSIYTRKKYRSRSKMKREKHDWPRHVPIAQKPLFAASKCHCNVFAGKCISNSGTSTKMSTHHMCWLLTIMIIFFSILLDVNHLSYVQQQHNEKWLMVQNAIHRVCEQPSHHFGANYIQTDDPMSEKKTFIISYSHTCTSALYFDLPIPDPSPVSTTFRTTKLPIRAHFKIAKSYTFTFTYSSSLNECKLTKETIRFCLL